MLLPVEDEVKKVLSKERKQKQTVLFPVWVDKAILETPLPWAAQIRHERSIGDFTRWKDDESYQKSFSRFKADATNSIFCVFQSGWRRQEL